MIDHIIKYFPELTEEQKERFEALMTLYPQWNEKINVISRKDIENLEINHLLHSLAIARLIRFAPGSRIMDLGTGGGLPGLPLAILMPDVDFHLIDRIGKKINVAREIAREAGISNVSFQHGDSGECHDRFDFVVSRAVMPHPDLVKAAKPNISAIGRNALPNGVIALKGGNLDEELKGMRRTSEVIGISRYFPEPFFDTKKIVYTQI